MPICQICQKDLGVINSNHLSKHNITLKEYIDKYGDPNVSNLGEGRSKPSVKAVKEKAEKTKTTKAPPRQERTIDDLYQLEETIVVPKSFYWVDQTNKDVFFKVLELIKECKKVSIDTETTGLDPFVDRITHVILTPYDSRRAYNIMIPLYHEHRDGSPYDNLLSQEFVVEHLRPILMDPEISTVWYNAYFDHIMIKNSFGVDVANITPPRFCPRFNGTKMERATWNKETDKWDGGWDGMIAANILNENEPSYKLKDLYKQYLAGKEEDPAITDLKVETFEEQFGKIKFYKVPKKVATCYGCKDGYMTRKMEEFQRPYVDTIGDLDRVLYTIEFPLIKVLCDMRLEGIDLDIDFANQLKVELGKKREGDYNEIIETLGNINLNSPKQLSEALFDKLKLPDLDKRSTKASVLEELADMGYDIASLISDYKKAEKLITTYLDPAPEMKNPITGKVHCQFRQTGTKTGRFSSSNPNLQNIPAKFGRMRMMFTAGKGEVLIGGDYSQIEPRLTAHTCEDTDMISAYLNDKDLYALMAAKVFTLLANRTASVMNERVKIGAINMEEPTHGMTPIRQNLYKDGFIYYDGVFKSKNLNPEDCYDGTLYRKMMKTLLLGITYGMSSFGLAARLKISESDAEDIINDFYGAFPRLRDTMMSLRKEAMKVGYVVTEWGRKRRIPDIWSEEKWIRKKAERQLFNSKIQGGAADMMKIAILLVGYDPRLVALSFKLLLTVHDELIGKCPNKNAIEATKLMIEDMIGCAELRVPLKVDAEIFVDGRWNSDSIKVSRKSGEWKYSKEKVPLTEEEVLLELIA